MNIPFDRVIWDARECAEYLRQESSTFLKRTQFLDGFPARLPIPGQPRWQAISIQQWKKTPRQRHVLYRHYDASGALLYVGVSLSHFERLRKHRENAPWFNSICLIKIERFETREDAKRSLVYRDSGGMAGERKIGGRNGKLRK